MKKPCGLKKSKRTKKSARREKLPKTPRKKIEKTLTLSETSHLKIEKPKVIAPSETEKNLALKTLSLIYQSSGFAGDEAHVFRSFLERFRSRDMRKEELYSFLRDNPSIRRKIWESSVFGEY